MTTEKLKSSDYLFQPIVSTNDQRKPPSPFQTGLRYLKLLGQIKRQDENLSHDKHQIKSINIDRLERTSAFSTNYYAPLPPLSSPSMNKSIQVDDLDDLSYKTAINKKNSSYECIFTFISIFFFILIILFMKFNSHPLHCFLHKKYWYPMDFSNGFQCENTNIQIHYVEIYSIIYQLEIQKNLKSINCLGFDILSCLPIDYLLVPKQHIIRRNNQLIKYCNHTQKFHCHNQSLTILPYEYKWNYQNNYFDQLNHCSCLTNSNHTKCFHFMIQNQCDIQIPWLDYCLKYSTIHSTCQAYIH